VRMQGVSYFLDSHHVGALEGALRYAGVKDGTVRVRMRSSSDADLLCRWS
jgi:hypothetical protein